jgi:hypothetical protein
MKNPVKTAGPSPSIRPNWRLWQALGVVGLLLAIIAGLVVLRPWYHQKQAFAEIERLGGYYESEPVGPEWFQKLVGDELLAGFGDGLYVDLSDTPVTDAELEYLKRLPELEELMLPNTQITDTGLKHLRGLTRLKVLNLGYTRVTDAGLEHLKGLTRLESLALFETRVSGAGFKYLKGLTELYELQLGHTQVTGTGLKHFNRLTKLESIYLDNSRITDAELQHLRGLTRLTDLWFIRLKRTWLCESRGF